MAAGTDTARRRTRGPNDPGRRDRIADAAIQVVSEHGIPGLTHRAVAKVAGVPVGSTTYHFNTLEDLLQVAMSEAARRNTEQLREWADGLPDGADFAAEWARLVADQLDERHRATTAEYDLYVAALHREFLRPAAAMWDEALVEIFGSRTDPLTGRLFAALFCGFVLQASLADPKPTRAQIEELARRALSGP
ncbi:TetR family transcriptional regulator [Pseudonocardia sp. C8]|uniref:TetR/AcrR family transcriptional regulator n=1 Tax=Pseudonocardia sp. C8 TaxID=2762759 RepID=UPI0016430638|nr:TetR family transcriptional regulator [Pseudonocardia sp. C8]MBC3189803.1 TetR family transcriptional regulator [Pseudonocardia sp. C8]